ncbi:hypothetical protein PINS_up007339 [Pythium insidiosum]|nr:hypothetical protein PINS_up007339 [Pythium insidiosum]
MAHDNRVQLQLQLERKARARELSDHEIRARNAQKMEAWRLQRMAERAELAAELRGDLSSEEEQRLLRCIESRERANEALHQANLTKSQKAADYEEVLDQLKLAMGATSLVEVVEKIQSQALTAVSLEKEKTQAEARLLGVRQEKAHVVQALNELKASGIGGIELNREVYNTLEHEIQQAKATLKVNKAAYERLDGVIQAVRQGSSGLAQRLQAFDDVLDLSPTDVATVAATANAGGVAAAIVTPAVASSLLPSRGGDNADALALAELKLTKILELVGQQSSSVNGFGGNGSGGNGFNGSHDSGSGSGDGSDEGFDDGASSRADVMDERLALWSPSANNDPVLHLNNIRVRPPKRTTLGSHFVDLDSASSSAGADAMDSARSDASAASDGGDLAMDVLVPSRDILKMSSSRHFAEVMRKREVRRWRQRQRERETHTETELTAVVVYALCVVAAGEAEGGGRARHLGRGDAVQAAQEEPARERRATRDVAVQDAHARDSTGVVLDGVCQGRRAQSLLRVRDADQLPRALILVTTFRRRYQTLHLVSGFMRLPRGQRNTRAKASLFMTAPFVRHSPGACESVLSCCRQ